MAGRVAIVAMAQTKYKDSELAKDYAEMAYETIEKVTQETGLSWSDVVKSGFGIDSIVSCSEDFWDGRTISGAAIQDVAGCHGMDETTVKADGAQAVYLATMQILSGRYDVVLLVGHCKESLTIRSPIDNSGFEPIYQRPLGLHYLPAAAMQAKLYMHNYGITEEQFAQVVVKNRGNAKHNPYAQAPLDITVNDVLNSKILTSPIKFLDVKPVSDGSCALIMANEEKAKKLTNKPVWIKGFASCYDAHYLGDRDLVACDSLTLAAKQAYAIAGISNPKKEIDVAEIRDEYSYQELLWAECLGFCARGEGGKLIDEGTTQMNGELPINPSGGMLAGNPTILGGMIRTIEAAVQLRQEAGERQIDGAKLALAHGATGPCGQSHCVLILANE